MAAREDAPLSDLGALPYRILRGPIWRRAPGGRSAANPACLHHSSAMGPCHANLPHRSMWRRRSRCCRPRLRLDSNALVEVIWRTEARVGGGFSPPEMRCFLPRRPPSRSPTSSCVGMLVSLSRTSRFSDKGIVRPRLRGPESSPHQALFGEEMRSVRRRRGKVASPAAAHF